MTDTQSPTAARDVARQAVRAKLTGPLFRGAVLDAVANEIADAALDAAWPHLQPAGLALCSVCGTQEPLRFDGTIRNHRPTDPWNTLWCTGSCKPPKETK